MDSVIYVHRCQEGKTAPTAFIRSTFTRSTLSRSSFIRSTLLRLEYSKNIAYLRLWVGLACVIGFILSQRAAALTNPSTEQESVTVAEISEETEDDVSSATAGYSSGTQSNVRQFHVVLEDLLTEFGYDVKNGHVQGLKNVAIRRTRVNEAIPASYEKYLEMLVSERLRSNSDVRMINCLNCSARVSSLVEGKLKITSPENNIIQLRDAARMMGIENFIDILLVYHSSHMILAIEIFNVDSGEMQWTKTYNSETLRTKFQKLSVDYSQIAKSRSGEEYKPEFKYLFGLGAGGVANVSGGSQDKSAIILNLRATEKFNNRNNEFGLVTSLYLTMSGIAKEYPSTGTKTTTSTTSPSSGALTPTPFKTGLGFYANYGHNFLGAMEFYDDIRSGYQLGLGAFFASGYIAPMLKGGWDFSFGRRFVVTPGFTYVLPSKILIGSEFIKTTGGASGDVIFSYNF